MLQDGTFSVWFKTPLGEGTGVISLLSGKISGRDQLIHGLLQAGC
jgi:hypothetical protein